MATLTTTQRNALATRGAAGFNPGTFKGAFDATLVKDGANGTTKTIHHYWKNETGSSLASSTFVDLGQTLNGVIRSYRLGCSAWGTGRTVDIGVGAATGTENVFDGTIDAIVDGGDVSSAVAAPGAHVFPADGTLANGGLTVNAQNPHLIMQTLGGTVPDEAEVSLVLEVIQLVSAN